MNDPTPESDLELLLSPVRWADPVALSRVLNARSAAAQRLADWCRKLHRITWPLARWFDWDRCRVNLYHRVAPGLVKWT